MEVFLINRIIVVVFCVWLLSPLLIFKVNSSSRIKTSEMKLLLYQYLIEMTLENQKVKKASKRTRKSNGRKGREMTE